MQIISLNRGYYTFVDDEDYPLLSQMSWYEHRGYAVRTEKVNGKKKMVYMHRLIMRPPSGMIVDHKDGNKLNNRRSNLRICTRAENNRNVRKIKSRKRAKIFSKYKGVYWVKRSGKWAAQIRVDGKQRHLGYFDCEHDAAQMYNRAAKKYFGEFASLNIISKGGTSWEMSINMRERLNPCSQMQNGSTPEEVTI